MKFSKVQLSIGALVLAHVIWGGAFPIIKWALESIEPFTFAFLRFFIATLILLPFVIHKLHVHKEDYGRIAVLALSGVTLAASFWVLGLEKGLSVNAPLIGSAGPIFLLLFAHFFLKEQYRLKIIIGSLISLAGVLVIVLRPLFEMNNTGSVTGNIFFILATISLTVHAIVLKKLVSKYNILTLTFWTFLIGSLVIMPLALYEVYTYGLLPHIHLGGIVGLAYASIFSSVVSFCLLSYGLSYINASETGVFSYIEPVIAAMVAIPLLGEQITSTYLFGALLVFLGIYVSEAKMHKHFVHRVKHI